MAPGAPERIVDGSGKPITNAEANGYSTYRANE